MSRVFKFAERSLLIGRGFFLRNPSSHGIIRPLGLFLMHSYTFLYNATPSLLRYDEYRSVFPTIINKRLALDNATFSLLGDFAKPKSF